MSIGINLGSIFLSYFIRSFVRSFVRSFLQFLRPPPPAGRGGGLRRRLRGPRPGRPAAAAAKIEKKIEK